MILAAVGYAPIMLAWYGEYSFKNSRVHPEACEFSQFDSEVMMAQHSRNAQLPNAQYRAYLIRLWREDAHATWRASAQSVQNGEMIHFATLHELFAFLEIHTMDDFCIGG